MVVFDTLIETTSDFILQLLQGQFTLSSKLTDMGSCHTPHDQQLTQQAIHQQLTQQAIQHGTSLISVLCTGCCLTYHQGSTHEGKICFLATSAEAGVVNILGRNTTKPTRDQPVCPEHGTRPWACRTGKVDPARVNANRESQVARGTCSSPEFAP